MLYKRLCTIALLITATMLTWAGTYNADNLPVTLYANDTSQRSYVSNPDGLLSQTTVAEIDSICQKAEKATGVHMLTVVVENIDGGDPYKLAEDLFSKHHVGNSQNTGLIMVIAVKDKKWRISTGRDMEKYITDGAASLLGQHKIVPAMKEGNINLAAVSAIKELNTILMGDKELAAQYQKEADQLDHNDNTKEKEEEETALYWFFGICGAGVLLVLAFIFLSFKQIMTIIAMPFIILFWPIELVCYKLRKRTCQHCGKEGAKYVKKEQLSKVTNYIYHCPHCNKDTIVSREPVFDEDWYSESTDDTAKTDATKDNKVDSNMDKVIREKDRFIDDLFFPERKDYRYDRNGKLDNRNGTYDRDGKYVGRRPETETYHAPRKKSGSGTGSGKYSGGGAGGDW